MRRILIASVGLLLLSGIGLSWLHAEGQFLANHPLPLAPIPIDNPQTDSKVRLGQQLFFDTRLSADDTISCATCHDPKTGWVNHHATDTGIRGQVGGRNSGTIINSAYMRYQFWDGRAATLEEQALGPIHNPIEMGETLENVVRKLNAIPGYRQQFQQVFATDVTTDGIAKAIAAFERSIVSGPSPFDRYLYGEQQAMSAAAVRGMRLFNGKAHCGPGTNVSQRDQYVEDGRVETVYDLLSAEPSGTRELLSSILTEEESHIDWIESQIDQIAQMQKENYLA